MAIHLGRPLPGASRDRPERRRGNPFDLATCRSYLVLLRVGFAVPLLLPEARCALTAPFHPCQAIVAGPAVCSLLHFPWGRPRRPLTGTLFPWSPDFPPLLMQRRPSGHLTRPGCSLKRPWASIICLLQGHSLCGYERQVASTAAIRAQVSLSATPSIRAGRKRR